MFGWRLEVDQPRSGRPTFAHHQLPFEIDPLQCVRCDDEITNILIAYLDSHLREEIAGPQVRLSIAQSVGSGRDVTHRKARVCAAGERLERWPGGLIGVTDTIGGTAPVVDRFTYLRPRNQARRNRPQDSASWTHGDADVNAGSGFVEARSFDREQVKARSEIPESEMAIPIYFAIDRICGHSLFELDACGGERRAGD